MPECRRLGRWVLVTILIGSLSAGPSPVLRAQDSASKIEDARRAYWEGRFEHSLSELERLAPSLSIPSERRDASFLIGLNRLALGDGARSGEAFRAAVEADPDFVPSEELYSPDVVRAYREARDKASAARRAEPRPPAAERSPRASRSPERFDKIKLLVAAGDESKEVDAILTLEDGKLVLTSRKEGATLKTLEYEEIEAAVYSYSKHPRWKEGIGVAVAVGIFAAPVFFMKGKKHWLSVQTENDFALIRLDKDNHRLVVLAFETRSGIQVETEVES